MNGHCSTCPVEPQCGYEHKPCDCRDRLKFKPKAAEQTDQPSPFDGPAMNHVAYRKLAALVADGHEVCGVMIQRQNADGTFTRGAVSAGGMVIWWHPEQASVAQQEPVIDAAAEAFNNTFHKVRAEVSMDWWQRIWAKGAEWARRDTIKLTPAEIQSGLDRVRWAEGLILQLPENHDGRNSWLLNYGTDKEQRQAEWARKNGRTNPAIQHLPADDTEGGCIA